MPLRSISRSSLAAWPLWAATVAALCLAACGGGGGSGATPHDAAVSIASTDPVDGATEIALGKKMLVSSSITSGTFKQASSSITCGGALVPSTLTRGGSSIATTPTVALPFGEACVLHVEVVAKSTDGGKDATTSVDVSFTTKAVIQHGEVVYASTGKLPLRITRDASGAFIFERTSDLSDEKSVDNDFTHCAHYIDENFFTDGRKLWNCRTIGQVWKNLYLDPEENALYAYNGPVPARSIPVDPDWIELQDGTPAGTSSYTSTSFGEIYDSFMDSGVLYFKDLTGVVTQIWAGDQLVLEEDIRFLVTYSNP